MQIKLKRLAAIAVLLLVSTAAYSQAAFGVKAGYNTSFGLDVGTGIDFWMFTLDVRYKLI